MRGWKTWTAIIIYTSGQIVKFMYPEKTELVDAMINTITIPLGMYGIGHKIDKANRAT